MAMPEREPGLQAGQPEIRSGQRTLRLKLHVVRSDQINEVTGLVRERCRVWNKQTYGH
jgi:hypothetical protein